MKLWDVLPSRGWKSRCDECSEWSQTLAAALACRFCGLSFRGGGDKVVILYAYFRQSRTYSADGWAVKGMPLMVGGWGGEKEGRDSYPGTRCFFGSKGED